MEQLVFVIHQGDEGGYWAVVQGHPLFTQGETLDELAGMITDAVVAYFPEEENDLAQFAGFLLHRQAA